MINIGIVIGVSSYTNADDLPACERDSEAVATLLEKSGRFADVLHIHTETDSASIKSKLSEFVRKHKSSEIGDAVFYFSGHGDFSGSDFSFILSDYEESQRNKTTLSNDELDGMIRSLKPKVFAKIVDACQSGITYIKDSESLSEYLKSSKGAFSNIYFMFSSKNDQSSYASTHISNFTKALLETASSRPDGTVRYKDIMDGIADSFASATAKQTPYFVMQADLTEEFFELDKTLRDSVDLFLLSPTQPPLGGSQPEKRQAPSLRERIEEAAGEYVSKAEALERLIEMPAMIDSDMLQEDISALYDMTVEESSGVAPGAAGIGIWIEQNAEDPGYFAKRTQSNRTVSKRVPKARNALASLASFYSVDDDEHYKTIEVDELYTNGYKVTCEMPFSYLSVKLSPKHENLTPEVCYIVPIISSTTLRIFYAFAKYQKVDFDKTTRLAVSKWTTTSAKLKDKSEIKKALDGVMKYFAAHVEEPLRLKYGVGSDASETEATPDESRSRAN